MTEVLRRFIEKNIELIEQNNFDQLYKNCNSLEERGKLTEALYSAGILVLENLEWKIPEFMFFKNNIQEIIIPDNIHVIDQGAFLGCQKLTKVVIPASVTMIHFGVFNQCSNLTEIFYEGTSEQLFNIRADGFPFAKPIEVIHCTDKDVAFEEYWLRYSATN